MTISRSDGILTFALPDLPIPDLPLSARAPTAFPLLLQLTQVAVQADELLLPVASIRLHPHVDAPERRGDKRAGTPLRLAPSCNQTCALKHLEMLGDGRLPEAERLHEFRHVRIAGGEASENRASGGIGERTKGRAQRIDVLVNCHKEILPHGYISVKRHAACDC